MILNDWDFKRHLSQAPNYMFEPTVNIFDKSVVVCYQKVGTRFFLFLSNWPKSISQTYNQYQINFNLLNNTTSDARLNLNTLFGNFETTISFIEEHKNSCYDYDTFFSKNNVSNINNFFLENPKDMIFVIRNPIKRFLSGITQVASAYISELITKSDEREKIKSLSNITDLEIDSIYNNYNHYFNEYDEFSENNLSNIDIDIFIKIIVYILNHKSNLYYYDVHTQNYLSKFKELMYNISDKSKIKIIDLEDCNKKSAYTFFNNWSDDIDYISAYDNTKGHVVSNKKLYNRIDFILNNENILSQSLYHFLQEEYKNYIELRNSKYFIKL
jgi:hypothetical protein